jgi:hypothetical protein
MNLFRKSWILITILLLNLSTITAADKALSLEQIIQNYTKAMGGKEAIEAAKTMEIALLIEEPKFKLDAVYKVDRKQRMRIDVFSEGRRVFTEAYDGTRGWQQKGEGQPAEFSSDQGSKALWHGTLLPDKLIGLHEYQKLGHDVGLNGREMVDGINYYVLKITLSDGFETLAYIHPETWLIERRRDVAAIHVDIDPKKQRLETVFTDYKPVEGVMRSHKGTQKDLDTKAWTGTTTIQSIKMNIPMDESIFTKP